VALTLFHDQATSQTSRGVWVKNKSVRCYKLFAAFELKSNYPVCFKIAPGNTSDSKMLVEMCDGAKKVVGKKNIEIVMFDKGFYSAKELNKIKGDLTFNTPAKKYKTIVEAIASIEPGKFKQYVLGKKYHKAQLKTLRTHVFDVFEDEDNDEITEEQYLEIVEFRNELRVYAETMNCLFSLGTMGNLFFSTCSTNLR
jgi:transposase